MEKLFIAVLLFATCWARPDDMSGKVFVFPKETDRDHVILTTTADRFDSATVCLRFFTDLTRSYGLFSMATVSHSNAFLLFKPDEQGTIEMAISGTSVYFRSLSFPVNTWHSICATWNSNNGVAQVWMDGKPSVKRFVGTTSIVGPVKTILGQEQDSYGGGFDKQQSFIGMISDVHVWDKVLAPFEIKLFSSDKHFQSGNVLNWRDLGFEVTGMIPVEDENAVM